MDKERNRKLKFNTISSFVNQIITIICGFILPKLILSHFGSSVNGLTTSINQFLSLITFLDLGVGAVVTSTLYGPLAKKDEDQISRIYVSAKNFFNKIALVYVIYVAVIVVAYPLSVATQYDFWYTATLTIAMSISLLAQYYFGIVNQLLLNADQKLYIPMILQSGSLIVNTVACTVLMWAGASIQIVKLATSIIYIARPLFMAMYVNKRYNINKKIAITEEPIKQKWNGLAQHVAYIVLNNTDTIVLSLFSTLENVSIYGVYNLVVNGLKTMCNSLTAGVAALMGNLLANDEKELLNKTFEDMEWLTHTAVTLLFTMCGVLIVPFVQVYTLGVTDADYTVPSFAIMITLAQGAYCMRIPYNTMVLSAGHYKQTQTSSFIEMALNIVISVVLVFNFGLIGVAIGTFVAMVYRTIYLAWYLSHNITCRPLHHFWKHLAVDFIEVIVIIVLTSWIEINSLSYLNWFIMAVEVGVIAVAVVCVVNMIFYRKLFLEGIKKLLPRKFKNS